MKMEIKKCVFPILNVLLVSIFPAVFLFCRNADEASFREVVPAIGLFAFFGLVLFVISLLITRSIYHSGITASILMLILANFVILENLLKLCMSNLKYWHTVPIILVLGLHICYAVWRFVGKEFALDVSKVICLVFGVLILINFVTIAPSIIKKAEAKREFQNVQRETENITVSDKSKPNIYLFIFDEYANFPQMEKVFGYDNAPLRDFLNEHNFSVSYTSHNESIRTEVVMTNLVNLDYVVDINTPFYEKENKRKNGVLFDVIIQHNYFLRIYEVGNFFGGEMPVPRKEKSDLRTINGENLLDLCIKNTVIYPFWRSSDYDEDFLNKVELMKFFCTTESIPNENTFTMVYLCFPHQPFIVDENGELLPDAPSYNWEDLDYYLGQYKYATKMMLNMLENIIVNDSNSIIIIQSDHGARATVNVDYPTDSDNFIRKFPWELMTNPLNAVYFQGDKLVDIEGQSSVNTLRTVLNEVFSTNYEMVNVPIYKQ